MKQILIKALLVSSLFAGLIGCGTKDKVQKELGKVAESVSKDCPMQFDPITRIDKCEALPGRALKYHYTLLFSSNDRDTTAFKEKVKPSLVYNIQVTPSMNWLRDNGVTFIYAYRDEKGNSWGDVVITPADYNQPAVKPQENTNEASSTESLSGMAEQMNRQLPIEFKEQGITILSCRALPSALEYTYQLHNEDAAQFDSLVFVKEKRPGMLQGLKSDSSAKPLADKGIVMRYVCWDKNGKYLCTITFAPEEYR
jgi:hypothetical protein